MSQSYKIGDIVTLRGGSTKYEIMKFFDVKRYKGGAVVRIKKATIKVVGKNFQTSAQLIDLELSE